MKPISFKELPNNSLFRIFAERRAHYVNGERRVEMVRSKDGRVYKKHGPGVSESKDGRQVILALNDLVLPYEPKPEKRPHVRH